MALDPPPIIYRLCSPHALSRARCSRQICLGLTTLTHTAPPALCPHVCRRRVHGRKVVVSGKAALRSATSPHGRETVLEGLWWWLVTLVRTELCIVLGIVPLRVLVGGIVWLVPLSFSLSLSFSRSLSLSLSLFRSLTHIHTHSLSLSHTLSLSVFVSFYLSPLPTPPPPPPPSPPFSALSFDINLFRAFSLTCALSLVT